MLLPAEIPALYFTTFLMFLQNEALKSWSIFNVVTSYYKKLKKHSFFCRSFPDVNFPRVLGNFLANFPYTLGKFTSEKSLFKFVLTC